MAQRAMADRGAFLGKDLLPNESRRRAAAVAVKTGDEMN
jgi:hypothetical protein